SLSSSPVRGKEIDGKETIARRFKQMIRESAANAANVTIAGRLPIDFAQDLLAETIVAAGKRSGMPKHEIGGAIGRGKGWAYGIEPAAEPTNIQDLFLDEQIFDLIQAGDEGKASISELAIRLSMNETDLKPCIAELKEKYITIVPGVAPETYELVP